MRSGNVSAFLLHRKPFRESAQWVSLFTYEFGKLAAIYRPSRKRGLLKNLAPFQALVIEVSGDGDLQTLCQAEDPFPPATLTGTACYAAFYLNELLYRLLPLQEPQPRLFGDYAVALTRLSEQRNTEPCLREFEASLLNELGYGLDLQPGELSDSAVAKTEAEAAAYAADGWFFDVAEGRVVSSGSHSARKSDSAARRIGPLDYAHLSAAASRDWTVDGALLTAKKLHRARIDHVLEGRPLQSRNIAKQYVEMGREKKSTPGG
jgi:DNA repair protein RecO (recombination protein O)